VCVLVKDGGMPHSCESPWKIASTSKRRIARRLKQSGLVLSLVGDWDGGVRHESCENLNERVQSIEPNH
jgi:hypothetical protein